MGLFSSKPDENSPEFQALVARWDGYLTKIQERYNEVLQQAEEPLTGMIANLQYDTVVMHNVLTGLKHQTVEQLSEKIDQGWNKMQGEMSNIGADWDMISGQRVKGDTMKTWLHGEWYTFQVKTYSKAANQILENVKKHIDEAKLHRCTQCGAELPIKTYSFVAINLKCDSCGSVNTYQPDDRVRALEYYVLNHFAEEKAMPHKIATKYDKNAGAEYYKTYYGFLMENVPEKKDLYERQMNERIKWVSGNSVFSDILSW